MPRAGAVLSIAALLLPRDSLQLARGESSSNLTYGLFRRRRAFQTSTLDSFQASTPAPVCFVTSSSSIVGGAKAPWGMLGKRRRANVLAGRHCQSVDSRSGHRGAVRGELRSWSSQHASVAVIGESNRDDDYSTNSSDDAEVKGGSMRPVGVGKAGLVTKVLVENLAMVDSVQVEVRGHELRLACHNLTGIFTD
ncbi:unnamed protein product [Laminaria digitata]